MNIEHPRYESCIEKLNPLDLVPPYLHEHPKLLPPISIMSSLEGKDLQFIVVDQSPVALWRIEMAFTYLDREQIQEYPSLRHDKFKYLRPVLHGSLSELSNSILFAGMIETNERLRNTGIGTNFQDNLARVAASLGYRFLVGYQNDKETARFFLGRGRYVLEEIKDEKQEEFRIVRKQESDEDVFWTIKFLNPKDVEIYIKPDRLNTTVENKINYKLESK